MADKPLALVTGGAQGIGPSGIVGIEISLGGRARVVGKVDDHVV